MTRWSQIRNNSCTQHKKRNCFSKLGVCNSSSLLKGLIRLKDKENFPTYETLERQFKYAEDMPKVKVKYVYLNPDGTLDIRTNETKAFLEIEADL